jgi:hypothetical protein
VNGAPPRLDALPTELVTRLFPLRDGNAFAIGSASREEGLSRQAHRV